MHARSSKYVSRLCKFDSRLFVHFLGRNGALKIILVYLLAETTLHMHEMMRRCLAMHPDEGYKTARHLLKSRYGQSYKVAVAYVNPVTNTSPIKGEDGHALKRIPCYLLAVRIFRKKSSISTKSRIQVRFNE